MTANVTDFSRILRNINGFGGGTAIGGEITEVVPAPEPENSPLLASALAATFIESSTVSADVDLESGPFEDRDPLITGQDSLLPNQNPITVVTPPPKPAAPRAPAYTAGPYLDGYFIFPTSGYNRGYLHSYNAVDISRGDDCLYENIPVYVAATGLVSYVQPAASASRWANSGYGNNIGVLHPNGVSTRYAHLKTILVVAGQYVEQGALIAYMGGYPGQPGSGNSTGCHLHFEVRGAKNPFVR